MRMESRDLRIEEKASVGIRKLEYRIQYDLSGPGIGCQVVFGGLFQEDSI